MKWRYATNKFDTSKKLTEEEINELLEAMILAPSSFGLQPWRFIVVTNPEIRAELQKAGYNQPKIVEASHLIVFAVEKNIDDKFVDTYVESISQIRGVAVADLKEYEDMMKGAISARTPEQRVEWSARQAYIALGVLVVAGAVMGIDVAPMEGFDPKKFDEILGLDKMELESKVMAAIGFRSSDDASANMAKVRYPKKKMVIEIK